MFKQIAVILLLAAFAAQTFNRAVIVFNYYTNTASFAKNCENKNRPMLHCNGHCQLMKKLKQEENKDKQNPERRNENKDEVYYNQHTILTYTAFSNQLHTHYFHYNNLLVKDVSILSYKPPQCNACI